MSAISQVIALARAIEILEPLIAPTIEWIKGGERPDFLTTLPPVSKSRIAYNASRFGVK